jgi:ABC-2 type transport system ATP-binding protein
VIEVRDLERRFGKTRALDGVSFRLDSGVTGLLGPNGAGKTTLLRCMLGIVTPSAGEVVFTGESRTRNRAIGYLPQKFGLLKELTVVEAMTYFAALKGIAGAEVGADVDRCLRTVNLAESTGSRVGALSGGMLRRVGIAAALLGGPSVLVFDEPTAGLDPEERVRFRRLIGTLAENCAVLISTHIVGDIEAIADRVVVLDGGKVLADGSLEEIAGNARDRVYLAPRSHVNEFSDDYYVDGYTDIEGQSFARVLSLRRHEGFVPTDPSVEDGYLCLIRGIS